MDVVVPETGEVKSPVEALTPFFGTWVRHGMPMGGNAVLGDLWKGYIEYSEIQGYLDKKKRKEASKLIQQALRARKRGHTRAAGFYEKALVGLVGSGDFTAEEMFNMLRKHGDSAKYRVGDTSPDKPIMEYLLYLQEEDPKKFEVYSKAILELYGGLYKENE